MASLNKLHLIGNVGKDPEEHGGVVTFSLATSERWKDKTSGEMQEKTEWHRIVIFGRLAGIASQLVQKGSQIYVEGSVRYRDWIDKEGMKRNSTDIVVNELKLLANGKPGDRQPQSKRMAPAPNTNQAPMDEPKAPEGDFPF